MSQELEIEFKNMLLKEDFDVLIAYFKIAKEQFTLQHNHYFETPDQQLRQLHCGLRIRQTPTKNELTLKEPAAGIALLETTDVLTAEEVENFLATKTLLAPDVKNRLRQLNIAVEDLTKIGTLSTNRAEINYNGGLLVFDHSQYADTEDYELEYEVTDEQTGKESFYHLLQQLNIPIRPAQKKLARFMQAIQR